MLERNRVKQVVEGGKTGSKAVEEQSGVRKA
jgi:hypothetical protein